jgi:hypothetical protein
MNTSRRKILKLIPALALAPFFGAYADAAERMQIRINAKLRE